jgi:GntR family transcriptional regulator
MPIPPTMDELIADIVGRIARNEYPPGSQLPPGREMAEHYNVSTATIQRAVSTLRKRGVLVGRPGRGVFVAETQPTDGA